MNGGDQQRRLRRLIVYAWTIPPVFGLAFILMIGILQPAELIAILITPLEPAYIVGWLVFSVWFLPRQMRPLADWLDGKPGSSPEQAQSAVRRFPLVFWMTFLIYLVLAPVSVIGAAEIYTSYAASPYDWFRIELVALIVSIIVGLPIFFLILDLFGQALGGTQLVRPIVTIRTRVFLIGALIPLLIDTMLVQYYWTRTGFFSFETFLVWFLLELLAIAGSLIFAHIFGKSLAPLQGLIGVTHPLPQLRIAELNARSTDEIGVLTNDFRALLEEIQLQGVDLHIAATAFESQESLMITDGEGVILRVNQAFTRSTGYTPEEIVGQTPRLLKSGRHHPEFYREMWETLLRKGSWQGEVWDRRKNGDIYPKWLSISAVKGENGAVTHYIGSHFDITERKASEEKIQQLAFYDPLTNLPNRRLLIDRLHQALASSMRSGRTGALLFIDLDNFKNLNDTLGHDMGDMLLQQCTQRLEGCIREGDTVARLGGDEFVLMLLDLSEQPIEAAAQTEAIGEKILAALSQPYQLNKNTYRCTASIGVTLFRGNKLATDELMKQADIAMYQAKKAGRNTVRFFDPQMQENISARVSLEGELHNALEFNQFHLYYQVQVDSSRRPLGAEALIRWIHPARGLMSPAQFIPLAEETGLILPIGLWVLETACAQLKAWEQDPLTRDLTLAVNVSAKQFRQADFVAQVQGAAQRFAINPKLLKLELTESLLQEDIEETIAIMTLLHEIGVQFSLDDFGTGYSSLQYLKRLPLDQLKIDRSFVREISADNSDIAVVRAIIAMANSLDLATIAEGVETEAQRQLLQKNGCPNYQGYLFGKPVPINQFEMMLKQG